MDISGSDSNGLEAEPNDSTAQGYQVSARLKIPPFWVERPELWFAQIEAQFTLSRITSDAVKFHYLVGHVEGKILQYVSEAITNPPQNNKYAHLKARLTECYAESGQAKIQKLLSDVQLGDRKPSQLLARQRELAGTTVGEEFLKTLWLRQLPATVQAILAVSTGNLDDLAKLADKVIEVNGGAQILATTSTQPSTSFQNLERKVEELSKMIAQLQRPSSNRSRSGERVPTRIRSGSRHGKKYDKCWYHFKFGDKASRCTPPCSQQKN